MAGALKRMFRIGVLIGAAAAVMKGMKLYKGRPEQAGASPFAFDDAADDPFEVDESKLGGEVNQALLERLVCPLDKGPLDLVDGQWLVNPRNGYRYPIVDGIPVMLVEVGERYRRATANGAVATA